MQLDVWSSESLRAEKIRKHLVEPHKLQANKLPEMEMGVMLNYANDTYKTCIPGSCKGCLMDDKGCL